MSLPFENAEAWEAVRGETTDAAAIVAHVANVFREYPSEAFSWLRCELASGNLRTREGKSPFVVGKNGSCCPHASGECGVPFGDGCLLIGEAKQAEEALMSGDGRRRKAVTTYVRDDLLVGTAVRDWPLAAYLESVAQSAREMKIICLLVYAFVWVVVALYMVFAFGASTLMFAAVGGPLALFLYFQVEPAGGIEDEKRSFDRLRVVLIAMCGVFASLVIFSREARLARPMTTQILVIGLIVAFSTFVLNPRRDDARVLRWANNMMRTAIAIGVACITVAVISAFVDGDRGN